MSGRARKTSAAEQGELVAGEFHDYTCINRTDGETWRHFGHVT